ncbi:MAG: class II glutamine amidotransferase, partial [Caulobacterales bacterium]|nr:class II glutamine amidotransferase [Caulobacterales bacterium]
MTYPPGAPSDDEDDTLHEECGVFGVFNVEHAASVAAFGLHALQHRGQEGCGILTFDGEKFPRRRRRGLVGEHFSQPDLDTVLAGRAAIGHVRYSTQGSEREVNLQPLFAAPRGRGFAIAHNGNLTNARKLREELIASGALFQSESDTEVILQLMGASEKTTTIDRFVEALRIVKGGFALVGLSAHALIGARDPIGLRPLVIGRLGEGWVLASETSALDMVDAEFVRDVDAGEVIVITAEGLASHRIFPHQPVTRARTCAFEFIYFARPDSVVDGRNVYAARKRMGHGLARENRREVDIVVPVPDSGVPAGLGYAEATGLPLEFGIIRSHHVGRT